MTLFSRFSRRRFAILSLVVFGLLVAAGAFVGADWWRTLPEGETSDYVGRQKCAECHQKEADAWTGSDHDRAMDLATPETVLGDFNDRTYLEFAIEDLARLNEADLRAVAEAVPAAEWALVLRDAREDFKKTILASLPEARRAEVEKLQQGPVPVRPCDVLTARQDLGDVVRRLDAEGRIKLEFGVRSKMFRRGDTFFVTTDGPSGKPETFEIKYVFGYRPLQQYLVEFPEGADLQDGSQLPKGSIQCLRLTWDTQRKRWYCQYPGERVPAGDELHWTGRMQNWNYMCADCHSTNVRRGYDLAADAYRTTFSEIDVSCETCHGPGGLHVKIAESKRFFWDRRYGMGLPKLKDPSNRPQVESCAPCHARRRIVYPDLPAEEKFSPRGRRFLDYYAPALFDQPAAYLANRALYYADGQIMDEDYEYGSFTQSKMFHKDIRCTDCHDPHSTRVRTEDPTDNALCTSCHVGAHPSGKYDAVSHHHHPDASKPGTRCVECHMPITHYMVVDPRRDHSFRSPRPDLTAALGIPNACNLCHQDQSKGETPEWAAQKVREWYGPRRDDKHFAHAIAAGRARRPGGDTELLSVFRRKDAPAIVRASALLLLADYPGDPARRIPPLSDIAAKAGMEDPEPLVRATALSVFRQAPRDELQSRVVPLLSDPFRAVRTEAARALAHSGGAGLGGKAFDRALAELLRGLESMADRPDAHLEMALLYEETGQVEKAQRAYEAAVRMAPRSVIARNNLGIFYGRQANVGAAEREYLAALEVEPRMVEVRDNLARLYYAAGRKADAEAQFRKVIEQEPKLAMARFALGQILAEDEGRMAEAAACLAEAARLAPQDARVRYNHGLALQKLGRRAAAEGELSAARDLDPAEPDFVNALAILYAQEERWKEAADAARRLVNLRPDVPEYRAMREQFEAREKAFRKP